MSTPASRLAGSCTPLPAARGRRTPGACRPPRSNGEYYQLILLLSPAYTDRTYAMIFHTFVVGIPRRSSASSARRSRPSISLYIVSSSLPNFHMSSLHAACPCPRPPSPRDSRSSRSGARACGPAGSLPASRCSGLSFFTCGVLAERPDRHSQARSVQRSATPGRQPPSQVRLILVRPSSARFSRLGCSRSAPRVAPHRRPAAGPSAGGLSGRSGTP